MLAPKTSRQELLTQSQNTPKMGVIRVQFNYFSDAEKLAPERRSAISPCLVRQIVKKTGRHCVGEGVDRRPSLIKQVRTLRSDGSDDEKRTTRHRRHFGFRRVQYSTRLCTSSEQIRSRHRRSILHLRECPIARVLEAQEERRVIVRRAEWYHEQVNAKTFNDRYRVGYKCRLFAVRGC